MARGRTKKGKAKRISFTSGVSKRKKKARTAGGPSLRGFLKALAVVFVLAALVVGLIYLDKYLKQDLGIGARAGVIEFAGEMPDWVSEELSKRVYAAATAGGEDLRLDEDAAASVQQSIETRVPWLAEVRVEVTGEKIRVYGRWRRPTALVKWGLEKFYVDDELVVLDYVPVSNLPIVTITGLTVGANAPVVGDIWSGEDLNAALAVLTRLERMDAVVTPDKPLLAEIETIDVANFEGRRDARDAHIVLYAKDRTQIIWGAEVGMWQRYLEATDEQKLAKLYTYYEEYGTLSGVKYINLRDPQQTIHLPIDKY